METLLQNVNKTGYTKNRSKCQKYQQQGINTTDNFNKIKNTIHIIHEINVK